jgi:hypothetical protein
MAWSNVAANQMVSFTDAQTGGFTLKSGQSSVTSNQCMTKNDAFTKYNLTATANTNSLASNQLMRKDYWVAAVVKSVTFSSWYSRTVSNNYDATGGLVTIVGASATFRAQAIVTQTGGDTTTNITINGTTRVAIRTTVGTTNSTTFTLAPGTYNYSISVDVTGSTGMGAIIWTQ